MWHDRPLKDGYDVVIIGGGAHGLACAHYLAKEHGVTDVAVLDKSYIGSGGSGRNTATRLHQHAKTVLFGERGHELATKQSPET